MSRDDEKKVKAAQGWKVTPGCSSCLSAVRVKDSRECGWPPFVLCTKGNFKTTATATCSHYQIGLPAVKFSES